MMSTKNTVGAARALPYRVIILLVVILPSAHPMFSQGVGIGTSSPDSSALLDMTSNSRGILIPRMSSSDRQGIATPAVGLMVFDTTAQAFYFFNGNGWLELLAGSAHALWDADADTGIQVEESADEDVIRFDVNGAEFVSMDGKTLSLEAPGGSIFIGQNAGEDDLGFDSKSVFIGTSAGRHNTQGSENVGVGYYSLLENTTGLANTALGTYSLVNNLTGNNNTAIGVYAMTYNEIGGNNTALGSYSLYSNETGTSNTALGMRALRNNTTGTNNTAVGFFAHQYNTQGSYNTALGYQSGVEMGYDGLVNATAIGAFAKVEQDSSLILGNAANVGIGTGAPQEKLHVVGRIRMEDGTEASGLIPVSDANGTMVWTDPSSIKTDTLAVIADLDGDTQIRVEKNPDEDIIRFDLGGSEAYVFQEDTIKFTQPNGNIYIGSTSTNVSDANIAIGPGALIKTSAGSKDNIALGSQALKLNTNGQGNIVMGDHAMTNNTGGNYNEAIGYYTLANNTTGLGNVAMGENALFHNTNGQYNVGIGGTTGLENKSGSKNTFIGANSGRGSVGVTNYSENVCVGYSAANRLAGNHNVLIGPYAAYRTSGSDNIMLGYRAGYYEEGSNTLYIENSDADSAAALIYGEFDNDWLRINGRLTPTMGMTDSDGDTKMQVEESPDEDIIRFDMSGTEHFVMDGPHLSVVNSGKSVFVGESAGLNDDLNDNQSVFIGFEAGKLNTTGFANVGIGSLALASGTIGSANTALGYRALTANSGASGNTAIGTSALASNSSGNRNTAIGASSLGLSSNGEDNVVIGNSALSFVTTPSNRNVVLGSSAGLATQGSDNVLIGYFVGSNLNLNHRLMIDNHATSDPLIYGEFDNHWLRINGRLTPKEGMTDSDGDTKMQVEESPDEDIIRFDLGGTEHFIMDGARLSVVNSGSSVFLGESAGLNDDLTNNQNVFVGFEAGKLNTLGSANVGIGKQSFAMNTTGTFNTALGYYALANSSGAMGNTAIGSGALASNTSGSRNTTLGYYAMGNSPGGQDNVAIGFSALDFVSTASSRNVAIGSYTGQLTDGSDNVLIGYAVGSNLTLNHRLMIDNHQTNDPLIYGEFDNDLLRINGTLNINQAYSFPDTAGVQGQYLTSDGMGNTFWSADNVLQDADGDTKIQVEEAPDEDRIRFDINGVELVAMTDSNSIIKGTGRSLLTLKTLDNSAEAGLAFQNEGASYTWSIHRTPEQLPDLVISGGASTNSSLLPERLRIKKDGNIAIEDHVEFSSHGPNSDPFFAVGSDVKVKIVCGQVNSSGNLDIGGTVTYSSGFLISTSATKTSTGKYTVNYSNGPFSITPIVQITPITLGAARSVTINNIDVNMFSVEIRDNNGNLVDCGFQFAAIGVRN